MDALQPCWRRISAYYPAHPNPVERRNMLAFEIMVDGEVHPTAGIENWNVLSVILSAVRGRGALDLSAGGLTGEDEEGICHYFSWKRTPLRIGSTVSLRVVDVDAQSLSPPPLMTRSDHKQGPQPTEEEVEEFEREEWLRLKAKFEP